MNKMTERKQKNFRRMKWGLLFHNIFLDKNALLKCNLSRMMHWKRTQSGSSFHPFYPTSLTGIVATVKVWFLLPMEAGIPVNGLMIPATAREPIQILYGVKYTA